MLRNEALAVRAQREQLVGRAAVDYECHEDRVLDDPADRILGQERLRHTAEALRRLKPQEVTALVLRAEGLSYREICTRTAWTYTRVNRTITEGRRALLERLDAIESGAECERWLPLLSALADGEATATDLAELRPHLRSCPACRATLRECHAMPSSVAALVPPALVGLTVAAPHGSLADHAALALHALAERATLLAGRAQGVLDGAPAAKLAAVAASTAALAGGGMVLEQATQAPAARHRVAIAATGHLSLSPIAFPSGPSLAATARRTVRAAARVRGRRRTIAAAKPIPARQRFVRVRRPLTPPTRHLSSKRIRRSHSMPTPSTDRRAPLRIAALVALTTIAALFAHPPLAFAGAYTVHTCQTPTGTFTGPGGWTSSASLASQGHEQGVATACTQGSPALSLTFGSGQSPVARNDAVSWTFAAPTGTHISSLSLRRTFQLGWPFIASRYDSPYLYDAWHDDDTTENQLESQLPPWNGDTAGAQFPPSLDVDRVWWGSLNVRLSCWPLASSLDCGPFPAQVTISRAQIGLTDDVAPDGYATGGTLMGTDPVRGGASLSLHATDSGGGVYRVALAVDGAEVSRQVLDSAGGSCADAEPANDDPYEFGTAQPCPLAVDGSVQLDTATLRDGTHNVHATVEDAGGNSAVVYDGVVSTHNAPIGTSAPSLSGATAVGGQLAAALGQWDGAPTGYDERWLRCDADGANCAPVAGATGLAYPLGDADAYHRMRVEVTAANGSGAAVARSAPSALVADAAGRTTPPVAQPGDDGGGSGGGGAASAGTGSQSPGGIQGATNPLGQLPGHVANGADATTHARLDVSFQLADGGTARHVRVPAGRRTTIVGRLTDASGAALAGARLGAAWRLPGKGWVARPGVRTDAAGRFVYVLAAGPSRDVRFTYFPYSDSRGAELSNVVHADVLAPLSIRADHRRVTGARVVRLSGRVGGGPVPRAGLLVTLEGFQTGWGWRAFRTVRTDRHGRWSTRYRFRLSRGRFGFRALLPHQGDFPYATTRSGGVFVVVS